MVRRPHPLLDDGLGNHAPRPMQNALHNAAKTHPHEYRPLLCDLSGIGGESMRTISPSDHNSSAQLRNWTCTYLIVHTSVSYFKTEGMSKRIGEGAPHGASFPKSVDCLS